MFQASFSFSFFFYFFNLFFALLYQVTGVDLGGHPDSKHGDGDDYERLHPFLAFFLWSFRNSIGDLEVPNTVAWTVISK